MGGHDGGRVDVLAIDGDGNLAVIELKRNRTPREVVAQILDYGLWVRHLTTEEIAQTAIDETPCLAAPSIGRERLAWRTACKNPGLSFIE